MVAGSFYARMEHGGYPVHLLGSRGFRVEWPNGAREYRSARRTIIALVNRTPDPAPDAYDPHLTFDRYFRRGRYMRRPELQIDIFDLFTSDPPNQVTIATPLSCIRDNSLAVVVQNPALGINLAKRGIEVRKLFYAGFARRVLRSGYEPEDVLQEVYKGLLVRNQGKCPFDAKKSSFAHYVHMVAGCILSNYKRRYKRLERNEVFGVSTFDGGMVDVAEADIEWVEADQDVKSESKDLQENLLLYVIAEGIDEEIEPTFLERCFEFMMLGLKYREMAAELCCGIPQVSEVVRFIRRSASKWRIQSELLPVS